MPVWVFRFGDVFDPDDPLSVWICTLGIAFNDVIYSNVKVGAATKAWERFYGWRVAIGHFNEAALHLERGQRIAEVMQFLESEGEVNEQCEDRVRQEVSIGLVDLRHARPHDSGEVEQLHTARDRPRRERVTAVVDPAVVDVGSLEGGLPVR